MKRNVKICIALILTLVLSISVLTGCSSGISNYTAADLVQNNLDLIYLNKYTNDYLERVGLTKNEADQEYWDGIATEVAYFADYFDIVLDSCDPSIETQITEMYNKIYSYSKYEVGNQTKNGDTYLVELTVYPIDIISQVMDNDVDAFLDEWYDLGDSGEFDEATDEEVETRWAQMVIDMVSARISSIGYLEPETISVQVVKDSNGIYSISQNDFERIDYLIIAY